MSSFADAVAHASPSPPAQMSPKRLNRAAVLAALAEIGTGSRSDITARTGLSAATVSRVADDLLKARLLAVAGTISSSALGRRSELLRLNPRGGRIMGVHLGGHSNDIGLADLAGKVYAEAHLPLIGEQRIDEVLQTVSAAMDRLLTKDSRDEPLIGIGVATGGVVDPRAGELVAHGQFDWRHIPLRHWFEARYDRYIAVGNSFQGLAWHESLFSGTARGASLLFVNCSTIIGAGFSTPNNLRGSSTLSAGQLGHSRLGDSRVACTCGRKGCLQATASDPALCRQAESLMGPIEGGWTIFQLAEVARDGDPRAIRMFSERAQALAPAISILANTLAPAVLVLGHNRHVYAEQEHQLLAGLIEQELYPPLRRRIQIRPVSEPEPKRAVAAPLAIVLREFYSPTLELLPGARGRLVPMLLNGNGGTTSGEARAPEWR